MAQLPPPPQQQQQPLPQLLVVKSSSMVQINLSPLTPTARTSITDLGTVVVPPAHFQQQQQQQEQQEQQGEQKERRLKGVKRLRQKLSPAPLYVVSTAQFFDIVNGASVTVAILPIAQELNFTTTQVLWILNAYTISFAGLLLLSGRLGDLFGHRRVFMFGLFWFALWALVVSFSTNPIMFILSRALQGIGAANTIPSAMALIATNYPAGPERTKAYAIFGAFGGLGAITGILLAGGLIASIGWQWIFRISAMAAFLLWVLSYFVIPVVVPADPEERPPKVDFLGALTATVGVTAIVYYISTGIEYGWASPKTLPVLVVGVGLIALFLWIETRVQSPLMPLRIWRVKSFTTSVILAFVSMAKFAGIVYYSNMVFQEVYQWTPIQTALGFLVHSLLSVLVFSVIGRILPRLPLKPLILTGFLLRCITAIMFSFVTEHTSYFALPFPAFIIHIFGMVFSLLPIQITAVRDAENKDQGLVGALYTTGLQLGAPFGIALLNVISLSSHENVGSESVRGGGPVLMKGFRHAFYAMGAMGLFAFVLALVILPWDKPVCHRGGSVEEEKEEKEEEEEEEEGEEKATTMTTTMYERESAAEVLVFVGDDSDDASSVGSPPEHLSSRGAQHL